MAVKQVQMKEIIDQLFYANILWENIRLYFGSSSFNSSEYFIEISTVYKTEFNVLAGVVEDREYMTIMNYDIKKTDWQDRVYDFAVDFVKWVKHSSTCGVLYSDLDDYRVRCNNRFFAHAIIEMEE